MQDKEKDSKRLSMRAAIARYVQDGDTIALEGFTHLIGFAAGHEIIRQEKRDLVLCRLTPDLIYDQMVAAGCARKLIFSWAGNPGVGSLHALRRAVEQGIPHRLDLEEYTHFGMVGRFMAGASDLPFFPLRSFVGSDLPRANPNIRTVRNPYDGEEIYVVPPLQPDVAILHAQRADDQGNTQVWGLTGVAREAAFASKRVIVVVEEIVPEEMIRADPNRTIIPGLIVDAVVHEPWGAHPSYVQGFYDRDNDFYLEYDAISRDRSSLETWLQAWVYDLPNRSAYIQKLGEERIERLSPAEAWAGPINYGQYK